MHYYVFEGALNFERGKDFTIFICEQFLAGENVGLTLLIERNSIFAQYFFNYVKYILKMHVSMNLFGQFVIAFSRPLEIMISCSMCTFENLSTATSCDMCNTPLVKEDHDQWSCNACNFS